MRADGPRGMSWHVPLGVLFIVSAAIVVARQLALVGPEFFYDYLVNAEVTNEKVSAATAAFGAALAAYGIRRGRARP